MLRSIFRVRLSLLLVVVAVLQPWPSGHPLAQAQPFQPPSAAPSALQQNQPAELATLAAGLSNDPLAIYDYVYNQIAYIPTWGLLKSPRETLLAGEGNPFDQAALLAALLEAAGFAPQYMRGTIRITNQQAIDWTGADDLDAAINILLKGGIGVTTEANALRIPHVWVRLDSGGPRDLDPSFKLYSAQAGQDLRALMGLNLTNFVARAEQGATITASTARQINLANLEADATAAATSLLNYLRAHAPFATVDDLLGARQITPLSSTSYPPLPYQVIDSAAADLSAVAHELRISLAGIDYTTTTDAIDGRRITVFYECATPADCQALTAGGGIFDVPNPYTIDMLPKLRVGGELVGTGAAAPLGSNQLLTITITTPGPGAQSFPFARPLTAGGWYAIPLRLQGVSGRGLARQIDLLDAAMSQGLPLDAEPVLGQILHVLGLAYFHEVGLGDRLDSRLAGVALEPYFSAMVASRDIIVGIDAQSRPAQIDPGAHGVDVGISVDNVVSLASDAGAAARERAWYLSAGLRGSAIEHAILEQLLPTPAVSTVQILRQAMAAGDTLYYIAAASRAASLPLLDPAVAQLVQQATAGRDVVVAANPVAYGQWSGTAWIELDPTDGVAGYIIAGGLPLENGGVPLLIRGGGGGAEWQDPTSSAQAAAQISQVSAYRQRNQGTAQKDTDAIQQTFTGGEASGQNISRPFLSEIADPINVIAGAFVERQQDLAALGGRGPALEFARWYSSARHSLGGPLGYGWSHTYQGRFSLGTDWARSFGERTAIEAAPALAAAQISLDLLNVAAIPQQRFGMGAALNAWLFAQVTDSAAIIGEPGGAVAAHLRLIDGSYLPPDLADNLSALSIAGDGSASVTWEDGRRMLFNAAGSPTAIDDANGNRATLSYDAQGRLTQVRDAVGRTLTLSYNAQGRISQVVDPAGRVFAYAYDGQGNLTTATSPRGAVTTYGYDSEHRVSSVTDPLGVIYVQNTYDGLGRVSTQVNGRGAQTALRYGGDHTLVTDPLGVHSRYFYDDQSRLTRIDDGLGRSRMFDYDAAGHLIGLTDGLGQPTSFAYDPRGHLTAVTDPLGHTASWSYNLAGDPTGYTDQTGARWQYSYDAKHNLTGTTDPAGVATQYTYNPQGQLTRVADVVGALTLSYDAHGNLSCLRDALSHARCWAYDGVGRATSFTDGSGVATTFQYDAHGNLLKLTAPGGGQTSYSYNLNDALTGLTDANGNPTSYAYDAQLNLTGVTNALGGVTSYQYDLADRLIRVTDAKSHATSYQYDAAGQLIAATDPLGRSAALSYDAADRLTAWTRADGSVIGYSYDALGRLAGIDTSAGLDSSFGYDAAGRLISAQNDAWAATYSYDAAGRITRSDEAGRNLATIYSYDAVGRRARLQVERNALPIYDLAYSYDAADRLVGITDQQSTPDNALELRYDAADRLAAIISPSGARTAYTYSAGRLSQIQHHTANTTLATYAYSYDPAGNITGTSETSPATGVFSTTYGYDALNRLIREQYLRYAITYSYDAVGNLTRRSDAVGALSYSYDSANQLTARGAETLAYDLNGNLTGRQSAQGSTSYSYDGQGRLVGLLRSDGTDASFGYDPFGRRFSSSDASGAGTYLFDGDDLVMGGADLAQATRYLYADGLLLARAVGATGLTTYQGDAGEHVRYLLDTSGQPIDGYAYDAYGRPGAPAGIDPNPFRFVGQRGVYSPGAGAWPELQMGQRYYDPEGGRFLTPDPRPGLFRNPLSQNTYGYALMSPATCNDPSGLRTEPPRLTASPASQAARRSLRRYRDASATSAVPLPADQTMSAHLGLPEHDSGYTSPEGEPATCTGCGSAAAAQPEGDPPQAPAPASLEGELTATVWKSLTGQGGYYALACSARHELLAGSFHAGLARSTTSARTSWSAVSGLGVSVVALGESGSYAGGRRVGVLRAAGTSGWAASNSGLAANDIYALAIEPGAHGRIFAGSEMGLFVSSDGGTSWGRLNATVPGRVISELAFAGTRLLAATDQGLFVGSASGATWAWQRASGLPAATIHALAVASQPMTVYAGTARGLYRSTDGGISWAAFGAGLGSRAVYALAIDPQDARRIFAGTAAGLFLSTNGGASWAQDGRMGLADRAAQIGALTFCPRGGDLELYVGSAAGVYGLDGQRVFYPGLYLPLIRR